jgi:hypothetical protein
MAKRFIIYRYRDHTCMSDYRQALYTKGSFYTNYVSEIEDNFFTLNY